MAIVCRVRVSMTVTTGDTAPKKALSVRVFGK
jgi:hypothetical protein